MLDGKVILLGTNSSMPNQGRFTSSQVVIIGGHYIMIDCGEGAQIRLSEYRIKRNRISYILISHLHGDHVFGLFGLLGSYMHYNRTSPLHIYGPFGIRELLDSVFRLSDSHFSFKIHIHELEPFTNGTLMSTDELSIKYFPLKHRIPTIGYRFDFQKRGRKMIADKWEEYQLSIDQIIKAKQGEDIEVPGKGKIRNDMITALYSKSSYAYCSDTVYDEEIIPFIKDVHLLYHETTYLDGMENEAESRMHSTFGQAVKIGIKANAGCLLTGHYSSRYNDLKDFEIAAMGAPMQVLIGKDGEEYYF